MIQYGLALIALSCFYNVNSALLQDVATTRWYHYNHLLNPGEVEMAAIARRLLRAVLTRGHHRRMDWPRHRNY